MSDTLLDSPLVLPHDVEGALVQVVKDRHREHLAKMERLRGKSARTYEPFATVARMSDAQGLRLSGDTLPAVLFAIIGAPNWDRNEDEGIDAVFQMGCEITVEGQRRADTLLRRDVMAFTLMECLYQRLQRGRGSAINSIQLTDYEPLSTNEKQRTLGQARMIWEIGVTNVLTVTGFLPPTDVVWPPDAGGAPPDPYTPPAPRPAAVPTFTLDKEPITE
jgi:hypothetical protein